MKKPRKPRSAHASRPGRKAPAARGRAGRAASTSGRLTVDALAGGRRSSAVAIGLIDRSDDQRSLALLLAPVLLIAALLSAQHALRPLVQPVATWLGGGAPAVATRPLENGVTSATLDMAQPPASLRPEMAGPALDVARLPAALRPEQAMASLDLAALPPPPAAELTTAALDVAALPRPLPGEVTTAGLDVGALPRLPPGELAVAALDLARLPAPLQPELVTAALDLDLVPMRRPPAGGGFLMGPRPARPALPDAATPVALPPPVAAPGAPSPFATCRPTASSLAAVERPLVPGQTAPADAEAFGIALAEAARRQTSELVIYDARYARIRYPMGDVAPLYGVCTDVVVRAYRALGFDLQEMVHKAKAGRGDTSIDHRRTDVLRRYFAMQGASLPVTDLPEDYRAGDIVTYYRPFNRNSVAHIAVVSDIIAPSGRPMIVHNRGWGPQLEDALFVDQITGHYRFNPAAVATIASSGAPAPAAPRVVRRPLCPSGAGYSGDAVAQFCAPGAAPAARPVRAAAHVASGRRN